MRSTDPEHLHFPWFHSGGHSVKDTDPSTGSSIYIGKPWTSDSNCCYQPGISVGYIYFDVVLSGPRIIVTVQRPFDKDHYLIVIVNAFTAVWLTWPYWDNVQIFNR